MPVRQPEFDCCNSVQDWKGGTAVENYDKLLEQETTPEALESTVNYLVRLIKPFLQTLEPVLICFPDEGPASLGGVFKEAVQRCEALPVFWGPRYTWKELLRVAFDTHANTLIGHPLAILGLTKLAMFTGTPLYIYDVIAAGEPFPRWVVNSLKNGLDCKVWGCYAVRSGPVIAGFSCTQEAGIHIREDVFKPILEIDGNEPAGMVRGRLRFDSVKSPGEYYDPEQLAYVQHQPCSCGCDSPRIVENLSVNRGSLSRAVLEEKLLSWSSVLDYRAIETESGLNLEVVVFPGELLPRLPTCAKLTVRNWNPEEDVPFYLLEHDMKFTEINR